MMRSVSSERGASGKWKSGKERVIWPMSPTVFSPKPAKIAIPVMITIATSAEGTALLIRGSP